MELTPLDWGTRGFGGQISRNLSSLRVRWRVFVPGNSVIFAVGMVRGLEVILK
ncbi:MAG: hypothetical protein RXS23_02805 [Metallosphaera yellowstonensis]